MLAVTWPVTKARVRASKPVVYQSFADPSFGFDRRAFRVTVISSERLYAPINVAIKLMGGRIYKTYRVYERELAGAV